MRKRIVITGMSMITPFGGPEETMKAIYANRSAIGPLPEEYDICPTRIGGRIGDNIDLSAWIKSPKALKIARRTRDEVRLLCHLQGARTGRGLGRRSRTASSSQRPRRGCDRD